MSCIKYDRNLNKHACHFLYKWHSILNLLQCQVLFLNCEFILFWNLMDFYFLFLKIRMLLVWSCHKGQNHYYPTSCLFTIFMLKRPPRLVLRPSIRTKIVVGNNIIEQVLDAQSDQCFTAMSNSCLGKKRILTQREKHKTNIQKCVQ